MRLFYVLGSYYFFKCTLDGLSRLDLKDKPTVADFLISFANPLFSSDKVGKKFEKRSFGANTYLEECARYGMKGQCILDSGAFSVATLGSRMSLREYVGWLKQQGAATSPVVHFYSNLDVIGDAEKTWRNQQVMELEGLQPRPVLHHGYTDAQMDRVIDRYEAFSIGGLVSLLKLGGSLGEVAPFLDRVFNAAFKRWTTPRIHGFGVSDYSLIKRYPFDTVDSSAWLMGARYARVRLFDESRARMVDVGIRDPSQLGKMPEVIQQYGLTTKRVLELFEGDRYELYSNISALGLLSYWRMIQHVNRLHRTRKDCSP